jgi:hypothetical protein
VIGFALAHNPFRLLLVSQILVICAAAIDRDGMLLPLAGIPAGGLMYYCKIRLTTWKLDWVKGVVGEKDDRMEWLFFLVALPTCLAWLYVATRLLGGELAGAEFFIGIAFVAMLPIGAILEARQKMPS